MSPFGGSPLFSFPGWKEGYLKEILAILASFSLPILVTLVCLVGMVMHYS